MTAFLKRWWWVLLLIAVGLGFCRLRFDVDVLDLLPSDEPTVQGLKLYEKHFTNARELIISLHGQDPDQVQRLAAELAARLRQQTNLVQEVTWQPPWMDAPQQLGELLGWLWFNQPPAAVAELTNRLAPANLNSVLDQTKEALSMSMSPMDLGRLEYDPYNLMSLPALSNMANSSSGQNQQMFASADGKFRVLYVESAVDLASYRACERWLKEIHQIVDGQKTGASKDQWNNAVVRYTGRPVFVEEVATSMQNDMTHSVGATSMVIAILFWLMHRRWRPMLWLLALLMFILVATLALGALAMGSINVVSMGFAAILLGLAVDYAVVHYQEALAHPQMTVPEIRRAIAPSILWAAITTMSAFLVLNLGGLPGLGQLGTLVAIGIGLSAWVMVMIYLPPLFPERRKPRPNQPTYHFWHYLVPHEPLAAGTTANVSYGPALFVTILILLCAAGVLAFKRPGLDRSADALHPRNSEAQSALNEMTVQLGLSENPFWLIVSGRDETDVYDRLVKANDLLGQAETNHLIGQVLLPVALWPHPKFQAVNRQSAAVLAKEGPTLREAALNAGFNTNAVVLTEEVVKTWARAATSTNAIWPTNRVSQWLLSRFVIRNPGEILVVGFVYPQTNHVDSAALMDLSHHLAQNGALLSGWDLLGSATLKRVESRMWQVVTPMVVLVLLSLWFAFSRATEIILGAAVLCMSGLCLLATMALTGWTWNLMNLMALPLILGTGVDYTIFIQLALRRHGGDLKTVRHSVGRALMLCGATAVTGFGSLGTSSNPGMASLGRVCAVGIGANMLISVFLLPAWWSLTKKLQNARSR
ncbi:MAG TPA: MMPL family transporter [Candidatus Acidoferrum sp.]|nr:MMPL family transporter [Candidatus Acidoferrum sp.]